jgi:protein TonB
MKGSSSYGWAILAALLLHGALFLGLNATVRFRAPEPPAKAGPISLRLQILPQQVPQPPARPAAARQPAEVRETVVEAVKPTEPATAPAPELLPEAEPQPEPSQVTEEAAGFANTPAIEPETLEREVSMATGANGISSPAVASSSVREVILEARPLSAIDPLFPIGSRIRGEQGDVRFQVWISTDGKLEKIQILQTSGYPALDRSAERALKRTRFAPRRVNGNAVPATLTILVRFQLDR